MLKKNHNKIYFSFFILFLSLGTLVYALYGKFSLESSIAWSKEDLKLLSSLKLPLNTESSMTINKELAEFGQKLFFDNKLSLDGSVSCASCHKPELYFTDGEPLADVGRGQTTRHTPTLLGIAQNPWFFWDGRKDSLWSQALGPLENPREHAGDRVMYSNIISTHYYDEYQRIFGGLDEYTNIQSTLPKHATPLGNIESWKQAWWNMSLKNKKIINRIFVNIGLAIAEYEKILEPAPSRFDQFIVQLEKDLNPGTGQSHQKSGLTQEEQAGLKLFINSDNGCINCHHGPYLANGDFQATGVPDNVGIPIGTDKGRIDGIQHLLYDEFNCYSVYEDKPCDELKHLKMVGNELLGAFKVPTLRNIGQTAPYMHRGQFKDLDEVLHYYNKALPLKDKHMELEPLKLLPHQINQLKAFLLTLTAPLNIPEKWLENPHKKSQVLLSSSE